MASGAVLCHAGLVARLELGDQRHLDAAHEADGAGFREQAGGRAHEEGALLLREHQAGDVLHVLQRGVVDDAELHVGELRGDLAQALGVGEAHGDHRVEAGLGQQAQVVVAVGAVRVRGQLARRDAELLGRAVQAGGGRVVEGLVAAAAHVVGEADHDVLPAAGRGLAALLGRRRRRGVARLRRRVLALGLRGARGEHERRAQGERGHPPRGRPRARPHPSCAHALVLRSRSRRPVGALLRRDARPGAGDCPAGRPAWAQPGDGQMTARPTRGRPARGAAWREPLRQAPVPARSGVPGQACPPRVLVSRAVRGARGTGCPAVVRARVRAPTECGVT